MGRLLIFPSIRQKRHEDALSARYLKRVRQRNQEDKRLAEYSNSPMTSDTKTSHRGDETSKQVASFCPMTYKGGKLTRMNNAIVLA